MSSIVYDFDRPKCLVLQRVIPAYRVAVFRKLTSRIDLDVSIVIGDDLKESKAKNAVDLSGIKITRLPARAFTFFGRVFTIHKGLIWHLIKSKPDVILCEAESHFVAYWIAIFFKLFFSRNTKLILWCFYALPGITTERTPIHSGIKVIGRSFFDGFISYTTYGKNSLISKGINNQDICVAVNVCDTAHFLALDLRLTLSKEGAKEFLGVAGKFVVTYIGTLDEVKRPDLLLEICKVLNNENVHFQIVGGGPLEHSLKMQVQNEGLDNINLTGKVGDDLPVYYRASDIVIVPGRGGIVISEAMCFGVPVIVHQADGVEYDLVIDNFTGNILRTGSANEFASEIYRLMQQPDLLVEMGNNAKMLISNKLNTESMCHSIVQAFKRVVSSEVKA